jgi:hypothetical protein
MGCIVCHPIKGPILKSSEMGSVLGSAGGIAAGMPGVHNQSPKIASMRSMPYAKLPEIFRLSPLRYRYRLTPPENWLPRSPAASDGPSIKSCFSKRTELNIGKIPGRSGAVAIKTPCVRIDSCSALTSIEVPGVYTNALGVVKRLCHRGLRS